MNKIIMIFSNQAFLWFISTIHLTVAIDFVNDREKGARQFLELLNNKSVEVASKLVSAQWNFETNFNEVTKRQFFEVSSAVIEDAKRNFETVSQNYPWKSFADPDIRRQLKFYSEIGVLALPTDEYEQFQKIISDIEKIQQTTTICDYFNKSKCDLHLHSDIEDKLQSSQDADELLHLHLSWQKATENELNHLLVKYVNFCNHAAQLNNYTNLVEYSLRNIEMEDVKNELISLWDTVKPLYSQIHAYIRRKLRDIYGDKLVPQRGPIPSHLLGNIWLENWSGIAHKVLPFPELDNLNFTELMIQQGYTPEIIHKLAEDFFVSMNFSVPSTLWFEDVSERNNDADNCHPKIFNFYDKNVRIKDCGAVSMKGFLTANNLLTKAQYMMQYSNQPFIYQTPADPSLETALSDVVTMSVTTFSNLKKINLFEDEIVEGIRLNRLFKTALQKITAMPYLLVQEFWRWDLYNGKSVEETKDSLHELREKFQGISTFVKELSFDPGGIGSAFSKLSLVHHFLSYFIEFQIYDSLCHKSDHLNETVPLDECDLYNNLEAGLALRNVMSLGSSKSLKESLASILGQAKIDSKPLLKYFEPLMNWLKRENEKTGEFVGWEDDVKSSLINVRRKRSLQSYSPENTATDDTYNAASKVLDRFQRVVRKRSKDNEDEFELSERERKSAGSEQDENEKAPMKANMGLDEDKEQRNAEKTPTKSSNLKNRRSLKGNKNSKETSKGSEEEDEKENENIQKTNRFSSKDKKRRTVSEYYGKTYENMANYEKKNSVGHQKRNDESGSNKNYENNGNENNNANKNVETGNNNSKMRYARKTRKKQRRFINENLPQEHNIWRRKDENLYQKDITSTDAKWHTNTKKDISRLLHSFGFAVENDDKDKIKELKKKLKGDSNSDLKGNIASKDSSYETLMDYNRLKSGDGRSDVGEDKGTNKLWSVKSYMTDNAKVLQGNPSLGKKDAVSSSQMTSSMVSEERSIGKKDTSSNEPNLVAAKDRISYSSEKHLGQNGDSALRHLNFDIPSLQALLKNADLNSYGQKAVYSITPEVTDNKARNDLNQIFGIKSNPGKYGAYTYKYTPNADTMQYKDKKEFREDTDGGSKSPYIIILGQVTPDMKERLMKEKGAVFLDTGRQAQLQSGSSTEEKKISDKRSRASEQIYIVPIDLKNTQQNHLKSDHYAEHEHETGHDPNTERDQETEEEQLRLEDKSNFYRTGKDSPSEFLISWNDKNRKIVKRSKREHKKDMKEDDNLKVVRIAPMKESILQGLLGKSLDQGTPAVAEMDHSQAHQDSYQPSSSLSSLANSVLSALSPKSYSQVAKASDLEEDNLKENGGMQATSKESKEQDLPYLITPGLRCNAIVGKKKGAKLYSDDEKKLIDVDPAAKGDDACCKKIILTPCPPKCSPPCPCPCPIPCPLPCPCPCPPPPCPCPCPEPCCPKDPCPPPCPPPCCPSPCPPCPCPDLCCKKPSECSLVNCQFKITKAKKPHERLTIMIYDRINPPAELPEPYDALAVISEILQRIQCCQCKPCCQLTEEDPDYPANDNTDQLKGNPNQPQEMNKAKIQELSGEIPILGNDNPEEDETDDNAQNSQSSPTSSDEDKYQARDKATPAIDQLTVFNKDKLKPVFIDLRKIDDIIKKRSQQ